MSTRHRQDERGFRRRRPGLLRSRISARDGQTGYSQTCSAASVGKGNSPVNKVEAWSITIGLLLVVLAIPASVIRLAIYVFILLPVLLLVLLAV